MRDRGKLTAVIANTMEQFVRWAYERKIHRTKSRNRWIDEHGEEYIPIIADHDWRLRQKLNGIRIDEVEDITYINNHTSYKQSGIIYDTRAYVESRLKREETVPLNFPSILHQSTYSFEDFQKSEMIQGMDPGYIDGDMSCSMIGVMKDGVFIILKVDMNR